MSLLLIFIFSSKLECAFHHQNIWRRINNKNDFVSFGKKAKFQFDLGSFSSSILLRYNEWPHTKTQIKWYIKILLFHLKCTISFCIGSSWPLLKANTNTYKCNSVCLFFFFSFIFIRFVSLSFVPICYLNAREFVWFFFSFVVVVVVVVFLFFWFVGYFFFSFDSYDSVYIVCYKLDNCMWVWTFSIVVFHLSLSYRRNEVQSPHGKRETFFFFFFFLLSVVVFLLPVVCLSCIFGYENDTRDYICNVWIYVYLCWDRDCLCFTSGFRYQRILLFYLWFFFYYFFAFLVYIPILTNSLPFSYKQ